MTIQDDDLIAEFVVESNDHLGDIESQLLAIEAAAANIDSDLVNKVFRAIHSIKGAAGFLGLTVINRLSHAMENVLNQIRNRELVPTSHNIDILLKSADSLRTLINKSADSNSADISGHLQLLEEIYRGLTATPTPVTPEPAPFVAPSAEAAAFTPAPLPTPELPVPTVKENAVVPPLPAAPAAEAATAAPQNSAGNAPETSVRVPVSVLDRLMNLAGELVLSRNQLVQAVVKDEKTALATATGGLNQVTSELQEAIMRTRMQPVGNVFGRFPRLVRDLSAKLNKQVEIHIDGKDVEVDKTIIEAIGDPLTHIIRNSVDHGIESPAVRAANGKSPLGTVRLTAYHQAGKVRIDVSDDGGGINPQRLRNKAVAMQLLTAEQAQAMSDRDAIRLIFHPGLSTAEKVTDVSGRGVGMDVVRTNIEKLGGNVDVDSTLGTGTMLKITLPLTLAIIPSLIVRGRNQRFAIPQANILELVRIRQKELAKRIGHVKDSQVLRLRDTLLPLVGLDSALNSQIESTEEETDSAVNIIVVEGGDIRFGLVVDGLHDSEEIVVKPLGRHLKDCDCLAGATILGDGHVALILDIDGIARQAHLHSLDHRPESEETSARSDEDNSELLKVLLLKNQSHEQFAIPMGLVVRIQRIRKDQITYLAGQELLRYGEGTLPLLAIEKCIKAEPRPDYAQMYVVVFLLAGREIGLIAPKLVDIQDVPTNFDTITLREPGVIGSLVVGDQPTRLLDLCEMGRVAHPEWYPSQGKQDRPASTLPLQDSTDLPSPSRSGETVLLAEDSPFFRKQVKGFLEREGYTVIAFEDGRQAWDYLIKGNHGIDIVVTDVEMPIMTGLQLCRHLKDNPTLGTLPVIALTTLAGDDDVQRGFDAGVDEYQIKMDREQLLLAVRRLLNQRTVATKPSAPALATAGGI